MSKNEEVITEIDKTDKFPLKRIVKLTFEDLKVSAMIELVFESRLEKRIF